jgi:hypothetical protein
MKKSSTTGSGGYSSNEGTVYKVIKLKTGEIILCELSKADEDFTFRPIIDLIHPVVMQVNSMQVSALGSVNSEELTIKPFLSLSNSVTYPMSSDVIITMGDMKPKARNLYLRYIKQMEKQAEADERDDAILNLLEEINPGSPVLFIVHETPYIVETSEDTELKETTG